MSIEPVIVFMILVIRIIKYAIFIRIIMSWIQKGANGKFGRIIYEITEPILGFFRKLLPRTGMLDLSPLIAFFLLDFIQIGLTSLIY